MKDELCLVGGLAFDVARLTALRIGSHRTGGGHKSRCGLEVGVKDTYVLSGVQPDGVAARVGTNLGHSALQKWQLMHLSAAVQQTA